MKHAAIEKHLADYLEGELALDERALVDAHLDECDACSRDVEEMLQTIRLLRTLPEPEIPPMLAANVIRRIRSGENRLGFFQRIGRRLGSVFEPDFVLPASAIAAAALVVTVVQGVGVFPYSTAPGVDERPAMSRGPSSVASLPAPLGATRSARPVDRLHSNPALDAMEIVARVERRAMQADRVLASRGGERVPVSVSKTVDESGTRIRIGLDLAGIDPQSISSPIRVAGGPDSNPYRNPQIPEFWAAQFARVLSASAASSESSSQLDAVERYAPSQPRSRTVGWPQQAGFANDLEPAGAATDPRDAWLALGFEDPTEFARYIAGRNLAEQELWVARLSDRAVSRGLMVDLLKSLRDSGDRTAISVADDFAAQAANGGGDFGEAKRVDAR